MRTRVRRALIVALLVTVWVAFKPVLAQVSAGQSAAYTGPRTLDGRPDLNGLWQVLGTAAWDLAFRRDGRKMFVGSSGTGAPYDEKSEKK